MCTCFSHKFLKWQAAKPRTAIVDPTRIVTSIMVMSSGLCVLGFSVSRVGTVQWVRTLVPTVPYPPYRTTVPTVLYHRTHRTVYRRTQRRVPFTVPSIF